MGPRTLGFSVDPLAVRECSQKSVLRSIGGAFGGQLSAAVHLCSAG